MTAAGQLLGPCDGSPLGRGRVNGSDVIIALLREMMRDEAPQTKIVDVIEREGRR